MDPADQGAYANKPAWKRFVFVLAGLSDAVDGWLAKRFDWRSELGAYLDPLADKLLIVSIFIALGVRDELPLWLVIAVVSRDILIVVAVLLSLVLDQPIPIKPLAISKLNTVAQIALAATVLGNDAFAIREWLAADGDARGDVRTVA